MLHRRPLVGLTVANATLVVLAFTAFPLPASPGERPPAPDADLAEVQVSLLARARHALRSSDPLERLTAVRLLGALQDAGSLPELDVLRRGEDPALALEAARAAAAVRGEPGPLLELVARCVNEVGAVAALEAQAGEEAERTLERLAAPRDAFVRGAALRALARRAPHRAVPLVREALAAPEKPLRVLALEAAAAVPHPSSLPLLALPAASEDPLEQRMALAALAAAGDRPAASELARLAAAGDPWDRVLAAEALAAGGLAGAGEAWRAALEALPGPDRLAAVARVRHRPPEPFQPVLAGLLGSPDLDLRVAAAIGLALHGDARAAAVLRRDGPACRSRLDRADALVALARLD